MCTTAAAAAANKDTAHNHNGPRVHTLFFSNGITHVVVVVTFGRRRTVNFWILLNLTSVCKSTSSMETVVARDRCD